MVQPSLRRSSGCMWSVPATDATGSGAEFPVIARSWHADSANPAGRQSECNRKGSVRIAPAASTSPVIGTRKGAAPKGERYEVHDLDLRLTAGLRRHGR